MVADTAKLTSADLLREFEKWCRLPRGTPATPLSSAGFYVRIWGSAEEAYKQTGALFARDPFLIEMRRLLFDAAVDEKRAAREG